MKIKGYGKTMEYRLLVINPGSTSTKIALFEDDRSLFSKNVAHDAAELAKYSDMPAQLPYRRDMILCLLEENGIRYIDRDVSDDKGYGNSITVDITVELPDKSMKLYSVRGTVTEGIQTVSRIDEFDRLYFEPKGVTLFCLYNDRPVVIATIARRLADAGINIEDMRNPHNVKTHRSLAILRLNSAPSANLVADIKDAVKADSVISTFV